MKIFTQNFTECPRLALESPNYKQVRPPLLDVGESLGSVLRSLLFLLFIHYLIHSCGFKYPLHTEEPKSGIFLLASDLYV